jgi:hypothetical protein
VLHLTTGTTSPPPPNKPITGNPGKVSVNEAQTILTVGGNSLVDDSFAAPAAAGCGALPLVIDTVVDLQAGLPSAAGNNTAILNGSIAESAPKYVKKAKVIPKS